MQKKILHRNRCYTETENNMFPLQITSVQECRDITKINHQAKKIVKVVTESKPAAQHIYRQMYCVHLYGIHV